MCYTLGIMIWTTSPSYAHSKGQVNITNKEIVMALRKYALQQKGLWFDWFPEVLTGLRIVFSHSHGYTIFSIAYKQEPLLLGCTTNLNLILLDTFYSFEGEEAQCMEEFITMFKKLKIALLDKLKEAGQLQKKHHY